MGVANLGAHKHVTCRISAVYVLPAYSRVTNVVSSRLLIGRLFT